MDRTVLLSDDIETRYTLTARNLDGTLLADLTGDLVAGTAEVARRGVRRSTSAQPESARAEFRCTLRRRLPWTQVLLAPVFEFTDRTTDTTLSWPMGLYLASSPSKDRTDEQIFDVVARDIIHIFDTPITASFSVAEGDSIPDTLDAFLTNEDRWPGFDLSVLPIGDELFTASHTWSIGEGWTYLDIANEMLTLSGYRPLWSTREGYITSQPAGHLLDRSSEWTIDATSGAGEIDDRSHVVTDIDDTPNVWLGISMDIDNVPTESDVTIYRIRNVDVGDTSINARGREVNDIVITDAASSAAVVRIVESAAEEAVAATHRGVLYVSPLPFVWHNTRLTVHDPQLDLLHAPMVVSEWELTAANGMVLVCDRLAKVVA